MDQSATDPPRPQHQRRDREPPPGRRADHFLVALVQALLGGVGGVYVSTGSMPITLAAAALAAVALVLVLGRSGAPSSGRQKNLGRPPHVRRSSRTSGAGGCDGAARRPDERR